MLLCTASIAPRLILGTVRWIQVKEIDDEEFFSPRLNFTNMREMLVEEMWCCCCSSAVHVLTASVSGLEYLTIARMTSQCHVLFAFAGTFRFVALAIPRCVAHTVQAVFNAELNLVDFPLDIQRLPIHLASYW